MPLDPEVAAYLESEREQPPRSSLTLAQTRETMRRRSSLAGPAPVLPRVEDLMICGRIPARQYWPVENGDLPVVIYFHGGRFISGDLDTHDTLCRLLATASERRLVAVDYRLAPEHRFPAAVDDACDAVGWALGLGVAVGVAGDSAGANLAANAAISCRSPELKCQALIYPMLDAACSLPSYVEFAEGYGPGAGDMKRGWDEYLASGADRRDPRASPLYAVNLAGIAPAYIITAEYDTLRDEGEVYARRLADSGVPVEHRRYAGAIHGFFSMPGILRMAGEAIAGVGSYLKKML